MMHRWLLHVVLWITRPLRAGWYQLVQARRLKTLYGIHLTFCNAYRIVCMLDELWLDPVYSHWLAMTLSMSHRSHGAQDAELEEQ